MTDEQRTLVLKAQAGDTEAFGALAAARRGGLLVLLAATLGDWDEAEDVLQDAPWRAFPGLRSLREPAGFDAWLRRIALNVARDHLRAGLARLRREGEPVGGPADLDRLLDALERVAEATSVRLTDRGPARTSSPPSAPCRPSPGVPAAWPGWPACPSPRWLTSSGSPRTACARPCTGDAACWGRCSTPRAIGERMWRLWPRERSAWPATRTSPRS